MTLAPIYNLACFRHLVEQVRPSQRREAIRELMRVQQAQTTVQSARALERRAKALVKAALEASK